MPARAKPFLRVGTVLLGLWALFHIAIGVYHTILFAQVPVNLYTVAYGMPVPEAAMSDPALRLGASAIEVYSVLLAGCGIVAIWAAILARRGQLVGLWLATILPGIASLAYLYGLILPGQLGGANAWAGPVIYLLGITSLWLGFPRSPVAARHDSGSPAADGPSGLVWAGRLRTISDHVAREG
jgi:hypothetical protein